LLTDVRTKGHPRTFIYPIGPIEVEKRTSRGNHFQCFTKNFKTTDERPTIGSDLSRSHVQEAQDIHFKTSEGNLHPELLQNDIHMKKISFTPLGRNTHTISPSGKGNRSTSSSRPVEETEFLLLKSSTFVWSQYMEL